MNAKPVVVSVDQLDFRSSDAAVRNRYLAAIREGLTGTGFVVLYNHDVSSELVADCYELMAEFFMSSDDYKRQFEHDNQGQRGYCSFGREHAKDNPWPDLKEYWHVGREYADQAPPAGHLPNIWPPDHPEFKTKFLELYSKLDHLGLEILQALAESVDLPSATFSELAQGGNSILRLLHYPPLAEKPPAGQVRAAPHEDVNLITLLPEATESGLELLDGTGTWQEVPVSAGGLVADIGDQLQNLSNGYFKSTTHRVVNPSGDNRRRFSMPFFCHARNECSLKPLPELVARTGGKSTYPDWTAGEFTSYRFSEIGLKDPVAPS